MSIIPFDTRNPLTTDTPGANEFISHESSPHDLMDPSLIRPIFWLLHQTGAHGIFADVLPFLGVAFLRPQPIMKSAALERSSIRTGFGQLISPKGDPAFGAELPVAQNAKQMQMVQHQQIIADQSGRGGVAPEVMQRAVDG
jgi:hypothetical protein